MVERNRVFEITEEHIEHAIARGSNTCPIAEVIAMTEKNARHIMVDIVTIRWSDPTTNKRYIFFTPKYAQQFIVDFDQGHRERARPFTLRLRTPVQITDMRHDEHKRYSEGRKRRVEARLQDNGYGVPPTKIGGHRPPTNNVQRQRRFGAVALKP